MELDFYGGYRGDAGPVAYDVGYVRYVYTRGGDCCGEGYVRLGFAPAAPVSLAFQHYHDFDLETDCLNGGAGVALPWDAEAVGGVGKYADDGPCDWNAGVSRAFTDTLTADVRYHASEAGAGW